MRITKRQLRRIIKEEKEKLKEMDPASAGMGIDPTMGIFNSDYVYNMFYDDLAEIQPTAANISPEAFRLFEDAVSGALAKLKRDLVR